MPRLIDADALIKDIKKRSTTKWTVWDAQGIYNMIDMQPTIEPKKGKWIEDRLNFNGSKVLRCDQCGERYLSIGIIRNFCSNCGADMRE